MQPIYWVLIALAVVAYVVARMFLYADACVSSLQVWAGLNNYAFQPDKDESIGRSYSQLTRLTSHHDSLVLARSRSDQFFSDADYPEVLALLSNMLSLIGASMDRTDSRLTS